MSDPSPELVHFFEETLVRDAVALLFAQVREQIHALLPDADVQHVGSTAIPGSLTKGDLDVQVRVRAATYSAARRTLSDIWSVNSGGFATADGVSFEDGSTSPSLGVHLTIAGGSADIQCTFRDRLLASPALVAEYDALKRTFEGRSMEGYREAKARFAARVLRASA